MRRVRRISRLIGVVGAVVLLGIAGAGPGKSESEVARTADQPSPSVQDWDSRCNDIAGSDLCLMWERNANYEGYLEVWYQKRSGPKRYIHLEVAGCGLPPYQVYEGYIEPGQTRAGAWDGYIYPGSCWVGYLRIGNARWTTGELYS
jgi:hypothetical protein